MQHVQAGISFFQISASAQPMRLVVGADDIRGLTEAVISKCVRSTVKINCSIPDRFLPAYYVGLILSDVTL